MELSKSPWAVEPVWFDILLTVLGCSCILEVFFFRLDLPSPTIDHKSTSVDSFSMPSAGIISKSLSQHTLRFQEKLLNHAENGEEMLWFSCAKVNFAVKTNTFRLLKCSDRNPSFKSYFPLILGMVLWWVKGKIKPKHMLNGCNKDSKAVLRLIGTRTQIGLQGKIF